MITCYLTLRVAPTSILLGLGGEQDFSFSFCLFNKDSFQSSRKEVKGKKLLFCLERGLGALKFISGLLGWASGALAVCLGSAFTALVEA